MIWLDHSKDIPKGKHALFGGSKYSWTNIEAEDEQTFEDKVRLIYLNSFAVTVGTLIHEWASDRINFRAKVVKSDSKGLFIHLVKNYIPANVSNYYVAKCFPNVMSYINDAIGFRLDAEVALKYTDDCFGTADAILYKKGDFLRIHDLKTGVSPASLRQLEIYASLCCLEYRIDPDSIFIELRIYQNEDILIGNPKGEDLRPLMDKIIKMNETLDRIKREG